MAYTFTNSKGKQYFLHARQTALKGSGKQQTIYFFAGEVKEGALDELPAGRVVAEQASGLPVLKKA
jgi:hypothetical protein